MFSSFESHRVRGRVNTGEKTRPGLTGAGAGTGDLDVLGGAILPNAAEWRRGTEWLNDRFIENLPRGVQWESERCLAHEVRDVAAKDRLKIDAGECKMEGNRNLGGPEVSTIPRAGEVQGRPGSRPT